MTDWMVPLEMLQDGWVTDFLKIEGHPESIVKIDFKQKLWIVNMRITSPIELYAYKDGECIGYVRLSPEDFEYRYEKEIVGYAKFLVFTIPIYKFKKKKPLSWLFFPIECDAVALVNRNRQQTIIEIGMYHSPNLSCEDFDIKLEELKEASEK